MSGATRPPRGPRRPPAERVRERVRAAAGPADAEALPPGYQRLGRVLLLRLPPALADHFALIGEAWRDELRVGTVLVRSGPIAGELREPAVVRIAGGSTETEVVEHGVRWRFDAARIMFAAGNRTERARLGRAVRPGEQVVDLFAGIGYFALPAARADASVRVTAVEKNPIAYRYLVENLRLNRVDARVVPMLGDNRQVALPLARADRVVLGYLPDAVPWIPRALELVRPEGGVLHVHTVADAHGGNEHAVGAVVRAVDGAGGELVEPARARAVKPYGPGRTHIVVDARVRARR